MDVNNHKEDWSKQEGGSPLVPAVLDSAVQPARKNGVEGGGVADSHREVAHHNLQRQTVSMAMSHFRATTLSQANL